MKKKDIKAWINLHEGRKRVSACTGMWQALPAALLPRPGFVHVGSWWQASSQSKAGGNKRLYRHLVNLWELLQRYLPKRGLMLDKGAHSDTCSPSREEQLTACTDELQVHFSFFVMSRSIWSGQKANTLHRHVWQHAAIQQVPWDRRGKSIKRINVSNSNKCDWHVGRGRGGGGGGGGGDRFIIHGAARTVKRNCLESSMWPHVHEQGQCQVKCVRVHY